MKTNAPIYLDYCATTPMDPRIVQVLHDHCLLSEGFGNPASKTHWYGQQAAHILEQARKKVADCIGAQPREVIWTSSATESCQMAVYSAMSPSAVDDTHMVSMACAHRCLLSPCERHVQRGGQVTWIKPNASGLYTPEQFIEAIQPSTRLVILSWVNNGTGVIQDIPGIAKALEPLGIPVFVDATQALGKIPVNVQAFPVAMLAASAHKIYGPKGVGIFYLSSRYAQTFDPLMIGGGQEFGVRAGTVAVPLVAAAAEAVRLVTMEYEESCRAARNCQEAMIRILSTEKRVHLNCADIPRVPHCINLRVKGVLATQLLSRIYDKVAAATGSACSSATMKPSHVLLAMGFTAEEANQCIRLSFGRGLSLTDVKKAAEYITEAIAHSSRD